MREKVDILLSSEQLMTKVSEIAEAITKDYAGKSPLVVSVLKGAFMFTADLVREIDLPLDMTFITASSYGNKAITSGKVTIVQDCDVPVEGRDVIIVEDILDTGLTLSHVRQHFLNKGATSVSICTMINKPSRRIADIKPDYCGFDVEDMFIVGYGLDYANRYRNLKDICVLSFLNDTEDK